MTSIRMALTELQRITAGRLARIAVLALVLVPTLYGGLYLYANHDPYQNLDQVPAALVVLDRGSTDPAGKQINAGQEVAAELVEQGSFDWHEVGAARARDGVREGRYDFALTVPADFSAALTSSARFDPEQARLTMTTNDANSYLSTTIADTVTARVRDAIASRVGSAAAEQFLLGFGRIRGSLQEAADGAQTLKDGLDTAASGAAQLDRGATRLRAGSTQLASGLATLQQRTASLPAQTAQLADGAQAVANGDAKLAAVGDNLRAFSIAAKNAYYDRRVDLENRMSALGLTDAQQNQLLDVYDQLATPVNDADAAVARGSARLDALATGAGQVAAGARTLADATPALVSGIRQARHGADDVSAGAGRLQAGAAELDSGLGQLAAGSGTLAQKLSDGVASIPDVTDNQRSRIARTIGDPVGIRGVSQAKAGSYGAGLAPFFMSLAAWIGGYVLFLLVRPLSRRAMAANQTPLRVALGGWLTPALVGVAQMAALLAVVGLAVRIVPENLPGTLLFLILMSATFVAIVHALNAWLGAAGQFLGLVLMVLQLVTAGGTFPWQTIPQPLHWLHHVLPMGYAVDGLRQLMYGGLSTLVLRDVVVLLVWLAVALLATSRAARAQRIWTVQRVKPELAL
ncbi:YhgE/Pip family protein [Nocardioides pocheonensis]|uniref:YhgE/Pip domain-containing protein n=1 Tax=Nocardioides pocheonensis TaxID=661485 RepID=A0A3N0GJ71_9ACTN|nr:YhgE/Pip domain-containing protein [Nocardioides pocheonensis]RNM12503.1 YhgE/Pip domain-containing protein [Nocardioides pocheonensis]